jgi:hypothetical protein
VAKQIKVVLTRFVAWASEHAGAACPDASALGPAVNDPWGHPIAVTCTDQPANQTVGAISAGPDGALGTADDIASWQLGRDVTALVRGQRWASVERPAVRPKPARPPRTPPASPPPKRGDDDDIPKER